MIAIVDYGFGNTGSIRNMLRKIGVESVVTRDFSVLRSADKLILPGVGSFDHGMKALMDLGLIPLLNEMVIEQKKPILGICLGMQLMTNCSEEGVAEGLKWIDASTIKFRNNSKEYRVPHMGWNDVKVIKSSNICNGFESNFRFYFVHSFYVKCNNLDDVVLETEYINDFVSAFQKGNIFGVQFHPEKSHKYGMLLLRNFSEME